MQGRFDDGVVLLKINFPIKVTDEAKVMQVKGRAKLASQQLAAFGSESEAEEDVIMSDPGGKSGTAAALQAQGRVHAEQAEYREALECWNKALCYDPDNAVLLEEIAQVYLELGRDFEALQAATRATQVAPQMAEAYLTLGRAQLNFGEPQLAQRSLEKVLELQPGHPEASEEINHVRVAALKQKRGAEGMRAFVA